MQTQLKPGGGREAQMKRNAPTSARSVAGTMTDLGCWEVGSRERRVQLTFAQCSLTGAALEAVIVGC
jgi:hypothetical protein